MQKIIAKKACKIMFFIAAVVTSIFGLTTVYTGAYAAGYKQTGVIEDLKKDAAFNENNYPANDESKTVEIIAMAESDRGEVFMYVYNPSVNKTPVVLDGMLIYFSEADDAVLWSKGLELVDSFGTLFKYRLLGVKVSDEAVRHYKIYVCKIQDDDGYAVEVGRCWHFSGSGDDVTCGVSSGTTLNLGLIKNNAAEKTNSVQRNLKTIFALCGTGCLIALAVYGVLFLQKSKR